jgi:hypothetical protein
MPSVSATPSTNGYGHAAQASGRPGGEPSPVNFEDPALLTISLMPI